MVAVRAIGPFEQGDPAARPDAADADDLPRDVEDPEAVEQRADVVRQRGAVVLDHRTDRVQLVIGVVEVDYQRRVLDETDVVPDGMGQLGHSSSLTLARALWRRRARHAAGTSGGSMR